LRSEEPRWAFANDDHVHHSNEQPDLLWDRLFAFFGFQVGWHMLCGRMDLEGGEMESGREEPDKASGGSAAPLLFRPLP
jgi:hypothetical protein